MILLAFSKDFDKVNYLKLLWKLHQYGTGGNAISSICAFVGNQSQTGAIEGEKSGSLPVTFRVLVPYGSVLLFVYKI